MFKDSLLAAGWLASCWLAGWLAGARLLGRGFTATPPGAHRGTIANAFESNLPEVLFDVTSTRDATVVFVYKPTQQNIRSRFRDAHED